MRNFNEQARVVRPFIVLILAWIAFFIIMVLLLVPKFMPNNSLAISIMSIPSLAKMVNFVNDTTLILVSVLILLTSILFLLPLSLCVRGVRKRYHKSNFPEGISVRRFSKEDYYIYDSMRKFFIKYGFKIMKGFDTDEVVTNDNTHFASIRYMKRSIVVLVNHSFTYNKLGKPTLSGFIQINHAQDLNDAKRRIIDIYNKYFHQ